MPKLSTIKFKASGEVVDEYPDISIDLHYLGKEDTFCFKLEDIQEIINKDMTQSMWRNFFNGCRTRESAIKVMGHIIKPQGKITKHLRISVKIGDSSHKEFYKENEITEFSKRIIDTPNRYSSGYSPDKGMFLTLERYISIESQFGTFYSKCFTHSQTKDEWSYDKSEVKKHAPRGLISWTQDKEDFLIQTHEQLDLMSKSLMNFFNVEEDDLEIKMIPANRLLETKD